jgi:3-oxoadipate enol-lactonase
MSTLRIQPDVDIHYLVDDFTDPWSKPQAILLLHGAAESSASWYAWVPHLARRLRVVRTDMRGFGASTPMPRDYPWSLDVLIEDFTCVMDSLGIERFHMVGAKLGGLIARAFAARRPERVLTLTVVGTPPPLGVGGRERVPAMIEEFEKHGVEHWARRNMANRLGDKFPAEGVDWWARFMGRAPVSTMIGFNAIIAHADISADLPRISCPTLVITTEGSTLASVEDTRAWQKTIPKSSLLVLPGNSYHAAATDADRCAVETLEFIARSACA